METRQTIAAENRLGGFSGSRHPRRAFLTTDDGRFLVTVSAYRTRAAAVALLKVAGLTVAPEGTWEVNTHLLTDFAFGALVDVWNEKN